MNDEFFKSFCLNHRHFPDSAAVIEPRKNDADHTSRWLPGLADCRVCIDMFVSLQVDRQTVKTLGLTFGCLYHVKWFVRARIDFFLCKGFYFNMFIRVPVSPYRQAVFTDYLLVVPFLGLNAWSMILLFLMPARFLNICMDGANIVHFHTFHTNVKSSTCFFDIS